MGVGQGEIRQDGVSCIAPSGDGEETLEPPIPHLQCQGGFQVESMKLDVINPISSKPSEAGDTNSVHIESPEDCLQNAHAVTVDYLARKLDVHLDSGLSASEAAVRLERHGLNKVSEAKAASPWEIFLRQVSNSLTIVLVITMAISFIIDDYIEGGVIAAVILLNIVIGFLQDFRAEQQILSLQALSAPISKVLRDGQLQTIKAHGIVPGDIVQLNIGDVVPADIRLINGINVATDEALLTGESLPIAKSAAITLTQLNIPIGDRINMCYSASIITEGRASGLVIATGMSTEVGKIAALLKQRRGHKHDRGMFRKTFVSVRDAIKSILGLTGTPLQVKLSKFALLLFGLAILLALIVFSVNVWDIDGEVLIYGICVAVAVIPESLIAVLTITVAVGTKAMAKGNVIVRKLAALEAVGGVNHICSDKTGTLTQGKMIARRAWIPGAATLVVHETTNPFDPSSGYTKMEEVEDPDSLNISSKSVVEAFLTALSLCNNASVYQNKTADSGATSCNSEGTWAAIGEPTEIALQIFALRFSYGKSLLLADGHRKLIAEYAFDSSIKRMTVIYLDSQTGQADAFTKGAVEAVVPLLDLPEQRRITILAKAEEMATAGLRVLCIARREFSTMSPNAWATRTLAERDLAFCGLIGLYDPPRVESARSVKDCQRAGITVHMLTGDHIGTAAAIAAEVGIVEIGLPEMIRSKLIVQAEHFDSLSNDELDDLEQLPLVVARCSPSTKVRMVDALHRRGCFCVMTGDGVNDSPSLKRADVGIAMGLNGSDVAKDAADMILTDDNFASIVKAVHEGRRLFANIQKFLMHLLISNIAQVILLLVGLAFQDRDGYSTFPLSPLEILWVNLITSSFLAIGLGLEEASPDIMLRPPHDLRVGVFTRELITDKMIYGFFMGALCLVAFAIVAYGHGEGRLGLGCNAEYNMTCNVTFRARATTWATLTNLLLVTAWEVKHFTRSLFALNPEMYQGRFAVFQSLWHNKFLFYAVIAGFSIAFPVIYLPVINRSVFKHQGITWEWGVVFGCVAVYIALVESWKATKRRFKIGSAADLIEPTNFTIGKGLISQT